MDQNNTSVDNDLQKAIDDITNKTNVDPVFSDPVAAPSSIPENDTGTIEPNGPFPEPIPEPEPEPAPEASFIPEPATEAPVMPSIPEPAVDYSLPAEEPAIKNVGDSLTTSEVKKAALRDLIPLLDKVRMDNLQRFNIYRDIFEELKDYTVLDEAYQAAREIPNEEKRAEALLYLVEAIDKM